jgi:Rrf2 family protein
MSAKVDYALRAALELAAAYGERPVKAELISTTQDIPIKFLENILAELRNAGIVRSRRGSDGGFWLARDPDEVTVADVIRAVQGPLATVQGEPPEDSVYGGAANALPRVWIAVRKTLRDVVEHVTLADVASGELPVAIEELASDPEAWVTRLSLTHTHPVKSYAPRARH